MNWIQAITLGVVQGLTEFLPVSSSGHLVLLQNFFGFHEPELLFDVSVHVGTLAAVCMVFYRDIVSIGKSLLNLPALARTAGGIPKLYDRNPDIRLAALIVIGSVPTVILGIFFHRMADRIFSAVWIVGAMLWVTGALLWMTRTKKGAGREIENVGWNDALVIGFVQGLAILPGISRSGATISVALLLGVDRAFAGRFSFLLSIPAILGALMINLKSAPGGSGIPAANIVAGTIVAGVIGYAALRVLLRVVKKGKLYHFSPYCWFLGALALIGSFL